LISIIKTRDSRILELEDEIRKLKQDKWELNIDVSIFVNLIKKNDDDFKTNESDLAPTSCESELKAYQVQPWFFCTIK
jgi:hypothetical protein